jgi:two-component system, NtrC family, response regulator AtoC
MDDRERTRRDAAASPRAPAVLLVAGDGKLSTHAIVGDRVLIGRAPDCQVSIRHGSLSRHHAELRVGPPLTVRDLGSTNGTRIAREQRVAGDPVAIELGESFHIGPFSFVVLGDGGVAGEVSRSTIRDTLLISDPTLEGVPPMVHDIAKAKTSVLVLGETGVGKEVLSQTLHQLSGRTGPCMRINCAALAESLLESELFGHEKGAFTGAMRTKRGLLESAHGGTAFLDEIGELALPLQAKLLRALEVGEVTRVGAVEPIAIDVRFIAATHRVLAEEVAAGRFRADLYYRLDGVSLVIPPLRERRAQIVPLALQFIEAVQAGRVERSAVTTGFLAHLETHDWPGNVRELKATVERAVLIAAGKDLARSHVIFSKRVAAPAASVAAPDEGASGLAERARIIDALEACAGNQTRAAKHLGVSRATLTAKLTLYRIPRPRS